MKKSLIVLLNSVLRVKDFVKTTESFDCEIGAAQGRYLVPANSIMGLFSLNILEPINITIFSDEDDVIRLFNERMKDFVVEENQNV